MKIFASLLLSILISAELFADGKTVVNFKNDKIGAQAESFSSFVGIWYIAKDGKKKVYAVDGRKWMSGTMSTGIADKAKALYGDRYAEFLDNITAYKYFPLTIYQKIKNFTNGTIFVDFKTISGRIDQAAGIAFDIQPNGNYLVIRANPLENNIVAFQMDKGKRSVVKWMKNIPTPSQKWHTMKVEIEGSKIKGYLNGKLCITFSINHKVSGKIGLWSKADSYVFFDNMQIEESK